MKYHDCHGLKVVFTKALKKEENYFKDKKATEGIKEMINDIENINLLLKNKIDKWRKEFIYKKEFIGELSKQFEMSLNNSALIQLFTLSKDLKPLICSFNNLKNTTNLEIIDKEVESMKSTLRKIKNVVL